MNFANIEECKKWIDSLKPGDRIALYWPYRWGWSASIDRYEYCTIKRITPKRTKFIMENGREVERESVRNIVPITPETDSANAEFKMRKSVSTALGIITNGGKEHIALDAFRISKDKLEPVEKLLAQIIDLLKKDDSD